MNETLPKLTPTQKLFHFFAGRSFGTPQEHKPVEPRLDSCAEIDVLLTEMESFYYEYQSYKESKTETPAGKGEITGSQPPTPNQ
jgi:hypothetical protein